MYKDLKVQLNHMGKHRAFEGWSILSRRIGDYELVLITDGQAEVKIENKQMHAEAGDLICFRPDVEHSLWVEQGQYMEISFVHFSLPDETLPLPFPDLLKVDVLRRLETLFYSLYNVRRQKGYLYEWQQNLFLQQILCEVFLILHEKHAPVETMRVRKVLDYIHEDASKPMALEDLLKIAGIRKTLFLQAFRNVTGTTPIAYIIDQRLENAKTLLIESNLPIAQIAEVCGFQDPFYFSRCFRKKFFLSPRKFRDQYR